MQDSLFITKSCVMSNNVCENNVKSEYIVINKIIL